MLDFSPVCPEASEVPQHSSLIVSHYTARLSIRTITFGSDAEQNRFKIRLNLSSLILEFSLMLTARP